MFDSKTDHWLLKISCGLIWCFILDVHNEIGTSIHTQPSSHTHFVWPSGPFQWNGPYLFLIVLATTWCGVVASQSVAARGFPRVCVCFSFLLSFLFLFCFSCFLSFILHPPPYFSISFPLSLSPPSSGSDWGTVPYASRLLLLTLSPIRNGLLQHTTQHVSCWAWEAQAFALYNCVCMMLQGFNHAESEHLLPAHSGRVGPSAYTWMYSRNRICSISVHSVLVMILWSSLCSFSGDWYLGSDCKNPNGISIPLKNWLNWNCTPSVPLYILPICIQLSQQASANTHKSSLVALKALEALWY